MINRRLFIKCFQSEKGISLVEALITILIFSGIAAGLYSVALASSNAWEENKAKVELAQELRKGMEWMKLELWHASSGSIIDVPADGGAYNEITFKVPATLSTGVMISSPQWTSSTINYDVSAERLVRTEGSTAQVIGVNYYKIAFERQPGTPDILEVTLTARMTTGHGNQVTNAMSFDVTLRN